MEPMNVFLNAHRQEFKSFVDTVCLISHDQATSAVPPSYTTPITILNRLPGTSREGFPSLPYLLDQARELSVLVSIWTERGNKNVTAERSDELSQFDQFCKDLRWRTRESLNKAEQAERPSGMLEVKWGELVENMDQRARISARASTDNTPTLRRTTATSALRSGGPSSSSVNISEGVASVPSSRPPSRDPASFYRTASQTTGPPQSSSDVGYNITPPGSSSGFWDHSSSMASSTDRLPANATHWNDSDDDENEEDDDGDEDEDGDSNDIDKFPVPKDYKRASKASSMDVENGSIMSPERDVPPRSVTVAPPESTGKRLADVWKFRKGTGGALGGGTSAPAFASSSSSGAREGRRGSESGALGGHGRNANTSDRTPIRMPREVGERRPRI
jgi:hypothetical protein